MDYQRQYSLLIESRKQNTSESDYHEKHHILPRSLGGSDLPENIVKLTAREHYIAHYLLAKIHGGKMWMALISMSLRNGNTRKRCLLSSRAYGNAKVQAYKHKSLAMSGEGNHFYGKCHTKESIARISKAKKGHRMPESVKALLSARWTGDGNPKFGKGHEISGDKNPFSGKHHSKETKQKLREVALNRVESPRLGKTHTAESRKRISDNRGKVAVTCSHCGKKGESRAMKRWHFDNCKHR